MPPTPPPLLLPFESPLCPPSISLGASNCPEGTPFSFSSSGNPCPVVPSSSSVSPSPDDRCLASLDIVATLKQGKGATLRRCTLAREQGRGEGTSAPTAPAVIVVKSLLPLSQPTAAAAAAVLSPCSRDSALSEAWAHAAAFSSAPNAVLPLYAAFRGEESEITSASPSPPIHLVLASAAGTARDAAAGCGGFLLEEHAAAAALSALRGCAALHSMGLVHGDVKPENLLILPRPLSENGEEEGEVSSTASAALSSRSSSSSSPSPPPPPPLSFSFVLSDFGSACPIGGPLPLGTLDFLPPEAGAAAGALAGEARRLDGSGGGGGSPFSSPSCALSPNFTAAAAASPAADVWAIGAATVDLLTGSPPFAARKTSGGGTSAARAATLAAAATEPLRLPRHLSPEARSFCELCLQKEAGERPKALELCGHEWFLRR